MRYHNLIPLLLLVVVGLVLAFWGMAWWNYLRPHSVPRSATPQPAAVPAPAAPRPEVVVQNQTIKRSEGGRMVWQVQLTELQMNAGGQAMAAAGMREGLIYDQNGKPVIRLTAQKATGNTADRNLEVAGDVRAVSQRGALITTEQIQWMDKERRLYCPQKVVFRSKNTAVTATALNYYVDQNIVKAPGIVRMYSGQNKMVGRDLVYNVDTEAFQMTNVQAVFNPDDARRIR
jgi:LPS export ABC transporter protein LptC